jgi:hypothetical protein
MQTLIIGQILVGVVLLRHAIIHLQEVNDCEFYELPWNQFELLAIYCP